MNQHERMAVRRLIDSVRAVQQRELELSTAWHLPSSHTVVAASTDDLQHAQLTRQLNHWLAVLQQHVDEGQDLILAHLQEP